MYAELLQFNDEIVRAEQMFKTMRGTTDQFMRTCTSVLEQKTPHVYFEHESYAATDRPLGFGMDARVMRQALQV